MKKLKQYVSLALTLLMVFSSIQVSPVKTEAAVTLEDVIDGYDKIEAENYSSWSGGSLQVEETTDSDNASLTQVEGTYDGAWLGYENLYFEEAPSQLSIRYANYSDSCATDAAIEVRLDSETGQLLQTVDLPSTAATGPAISTLTVDAENGDSYVGTHDLYFVLTGTTDTEHLFIANLDYFEFRQEVVEDVIQKAISLNVGADETKRNITWYADNDDPGYLQIAKKSDMSGSEFPEGKAVTYTAGVESANDSGFYSNQLVISDLELDTEYVYRLINGGTISDIYSFTTGTEGDFSFLFAGDPQIGSGSTSTDTTGWDNTLTKAAAAFPDTDFIVSAGDQVEKASNEDQYAGFLNHDVLYSIPVATTIGNHDTASAAYSQHFYNPNVSSDYGVTTAGSDYWYVYNNVLFMDLNSNDLSTAEHSAFMEEAISANPDVDWKIVVFHHSIYSVASHAADTDIIQRRNELAPIFKELDIDVVLMGHDHVYVRTYMMDGLIPIVETNEDGTPLSSVTDPEGILYVTANSASGSKYYSIQNQTFEYAAVKNQESTPNISNVEVTEDSFKITTYRVSDMSVVDSFEIDHTTDSVTKPVTTADTGTKGVENDTSTLAISKVASFDSGVINEEGGSAEIVKYNKDNDKYYVVNGTTGNLDIVPREIYEEGVNDSTAKGESINLKSDLESLITGFSYGDMTSVDVNTSLDVIAVGVQAEGTDDDSILVFLSYDGEILKTVTAGKQVDMVTFTKDGTKLLAANEGEPRDGYEEGTTDPKGSVTVVDLENGLDSAVSTNVTFDAMDALRDSLVADGVIIKKDTMPSVDFEPEYIAVDEDGEYAYVTLQEANAVATLDLTTLEFTSVKSLGFKNHNLTENALDLMKDNQINITTQNVYGIYMPDGIATYEYNGKTYLITANEGDSRDWGDYSNEVKKTVNGYNITAFDTSDYDGVDESKTYIFGGRSFSVYDASTMEQVYDSGSDFESITAKYFPEYFNCSNDNTSLDSRSGKKGPEPENVVIGSVGDSVYAFIGLERIGGIMVYDISNAEEPEYVNYINSRDFSEDIAGDDSPEGLCFVDATSSYSGVAEVFAAFEVSGTVGIYQVTEQEENEGTTPTPTPEATTPTVTPTPGETTPTITPTPTPTKKGKGYKGSSSSSSQTTPTQTPTAIPEVKNAESFTVSMSQTVFTYSGKENMPEVTVKAGSDTLEQGSDYSLSYSNNINVGTGTVTISGKGDYNGTVKKYFSIIPKTTTLSVSKKTSTSNTLNWEKVEGVTGYEIYSYRSKEDKYVKIKSLDSVFTSYTVRKMTPGTSYRYRIRAYQIVNGRKYYSEYSNVLYTASNKAN